MAFPARSLPLILGLALTGSAVLAAQQGEIRNPNPASAPQVPASDATAPAAQMKDEAKPAADPVAADALRLDPKGTGEAAPDKALPASASGYASTDSDAPVAFPLPDASVSPAAPAPEVPDPNRPVLSGETDLGQLRQAIDLYRKGKVSDGDRLAAGFTDPAARALLEWVAIRAGAGIGFERVVAFTRANPDWPAGPLLRRRAEEMLLSEKKSPAVVRAFFATSKPASAPGKFALALALRAEGSMRMPPLWCATSGARTASARASRPRWPTPSPACSP